MKVLQEILITASLCEKELLGFCNEKGQKMILKAKFMTFFLMFSVVFGHALYGKSVLPDKKNTFHPQLKKMVVCIPSSLKDFGYVYQGQKLRHTFEIKNISNKYIPIKETKNSCGCTSILSSYDGIGPNETISIEAIIDTSGKPEECFSVSIILILDEGLGKVKLELAGQIIIPNPERIDFGRVYKNKKIMGKCFYLKTLPGEHLDILEVSYDKGFFDIKIVAPNFWNRLEYHKIIIKYRKTMPDGNFDQKVVFKTNRSYRPNFSVILTGRMVGSIESNPEVVSLGVLRPNAEVTKKFKVYSPYGKLFAIKNIVNPFPENLSIEYTPAQKNKEHIIKIHSKKDFPPGKISGKLKFVTTINDNLDVGIFGIQRKL